jgi:hypothetical protein
MDDKLYYQLPFLKKHHQQKLVKNTIQSHIRAKFYIDEAQCQLQILRHGTADKYVNIFTNSNLSFIWLLKRRVGHNVKAAGALVVMVAEVVLTAPDVPF